MNVNNNSVQAHQAQAQKQGQFQGQSSLNSGVNSAVGAGNVTEVITPPAAYAPNLAGLVGTACMGSVSASAGGGGIFSLGLGATYKDSDCERRAFAAFFVGVGHPDVAVALLCQNDDVAKAMTAVGAICPVAPTAPVSSQTSGRKISPTDPNYAPYDR